MQNQRGRNLTRGVTFVSTRVLHILQTTCTPSLPLRSRIWSTDCSKSSLSLGAGPQMAHEIARPTGCTTCSRLSSPGWTLHNFFLRPATSFRVSPRLSLTYLDRRRSAGSETQSDRAAGSKTQPDRAAGSETQPDRAAGFGATARQSGLVGGTARQSGRVGNTARQSGRAGHRPAFLQRTSVET